MRLEHQYIYRIYADGSFTKAAENLFLTQPALSIAVSKYESELGAPIFDRKSRPVELTSVGEVVIEKIKKIMELEDDLLKEVEDIKNLQGGKLIVAGTNYVNSYVLAPIISEFIKKYPGIEVIIREDSSDKLLNLLENKEIDLTFSCGEIRTDKFNKIESFRDDMLLVVSDDLIEKMGLNAIKSKNEIIKEVLKNIPFIILRNQNNLYLRSLKIFEELEVKPKIVQRVDQLVTSYKFCTEGMGAAFIGSKLIEKEQNKEISAYEVELDVAKRLFFAVTKKDSYVSYATKKFIEMVKNYYGEDFN